MSERTERTTKKAKHGEEWEKMRVRFTRKYTEIGENAENCGDL